MLELLQDLHPPCRLLGICVFTSLDDQTAPLTDCTSSGYENIILSTPLPTVNEFPNFGQSDECKKLSHHCFYVVYSLVSNAQEHLCFLDIQITSSSANCLLTFYIHLPDCLFSINLHWVLWLSIHCTYLFLMYHL